MLHCVPLRIHPSPFPLPGGERVGGNHGYIPGVPSASVQLPASTPPATTCVIEVGTGFLGSAVGVGEGTAVCAGSAQASMASTSEVRTIERIGRAIGSHSIRCRRRTAPFGMSGKTPSLTASSPAETAKHSLPVLGRGPPSRMVLGAFRAKREEKRASPRDCQQRYSPILLQGEFGAALLGLGAGEGP